MDTNSDFLEALSVALIQRENHLKETVGAGLREDIGQAKTSYESLLSFLYEKGHIKRDPYQAEQTLDKRALPKDEPLTGRDRSTELTKRLEQFRVVLSYLGEELQPTASQISHQDITLFEQAFAFIDWNQFTDSSSHPTTAALATLVSTSQKTANEVSLRILSDATTTIGKKFLEASQKLGELLALRQQFIKLKVRNQILTQIPENTSIESFIAAVKEQWDTVFSGEPFSQTILLEIWAENDPKTGADARAALLASLVVEAEAEDPVQEVRSSKEQLIDGVRAIASCSAALEKMADKLQGNGSLMGKGGKAGGNFIQNILTSLFGKSGEEQPIAIAVKDGDRGAKRNEMILLSNFIADIKKKAKVYAGLLARSGSTWERVQSSTDSKLSDFLRRELEDVSVILQRSQGADDYFRKNTAPAHKSRIRGTNMESAAIQEHLLRASKKLEEYGS